LQTEPIAESELERVRTIVANRYVFGNETPRDRAGLYGYYQSVIGDLDPALNYPNRIHTLEVTDLQEAAQRYLTLQAYGMVVSKPAE
jgi:predicted Zn-dependent peptidase